MAVCHLGVFAFLCSRCTVVGTACLKVQLSQLHFAGCLCILLCYTLKLCSRETVHIVMCLHTKSIQSGSFCRLHVFDQFYDTLTLGVVRLSEVIVVKYYIRWCIFVCILESIDDEFVALVYSPPHGIASMTGIRCTCITFIRNNLIITVCIAIDRLIYNIPAIKETCILFVCSLSKIMIKHTGNKPLQSAVHSFLIYVWLCNIIVLVEEPFRSL